MVAMARLHVAKSRERNLEMSPVPHPRLLALLAPYRAEVLTLTGSRDYRFDNC